MAAGDDEGQRGQGHLAVGQERRLDVAGDVVHGHQRLAVHERDALGRLHADEQRAHQPGPLRHRHRVELRVRRAARRAIACSITGQMFSRWWREASSGTTPP